MSLTEQILQRMYRIIYHDFPGIGSRVACIMLNSRSPTIYCIKQYRTKKNNKETWIEKNGSSQHHAKILIKMVKLSSTWTHVRRHTKLAKATQNAVTITLSYHAMPYYHITIPYYITPCHVILYHMISYHAISFHIILYHTMPNYIISYHTYIILYHGISYHTIYISQVYTARMQPQSAASARWAGSLATSLWI